MKWFDVRITDRGVDAFALLSPRLTPQNYHNTPSSSLTVWANCILLHLLQTRSAKHSHFFSGSCHATVFFRTSRRLDSMQYFYFNRPLREKRVKEIEGVSPSQSLSASSFNQF